MPVQKPSRRKLLALSGAALSGAVLPADVPTAAAPSTSADDKAGVGAAWPARRKKIELAWLDLLGEFPTEVLPLEPAMKQVAEENGITRYHVSFQTETDDRVTAWL